MNHSSNTRLFIQLTGVFLAIGWVSEGLASPLIDPNATYEVRAVVAGATDEVESGTTDFAVSSFQASEASALSGEAAEAALMTTVGAVRVSGQLTSSASGGGGSGSIFDLTFSLDAPTDVWLTGHAGGSNGESFVALRTSSGGGILQTLVTEGSLDLSTLQSGPETLGPGDYRILASTRAISGGTEPVGSSQLDFRFLFGNPIAPVGDLDGSGSVEQSDLNLVLNNWGQPRSFESSGEPFATPTVDQEELNRVLNNWGGTSAPNFNGLSVPEPAAAGAAALFGLICCRRRERCSKGRRRHDTGGLPLF